MLFLSLKLGERHIQEEEQNFSFLLLFSFFFFFLFFPSPFVELLRHTAALGSMFEPSLSAPTLDLSVSSWGVGGGIEL